ncbi:Na+/H+ antiporter subunit E [Tepidamorphus sp. 3E244]|uniref:Na+/H+ antiporter subunit E n=1 Tax=Tepidamorphus sp. 3E244 TaxID=3385498 RepID=UPI0038FCF4C0
MAALFAVLYGYWLLLSGHYTLWLNVSGAILVALTVLWAFRIGVVDREGVPVHMLGRAVIYWPWLVWEIIKAALDVSLRIVKPSLPISPDLRRFKASQKTPEGLTTYANSITLTPGTITILVDWRGHEVVVHGLSQDGLDGVASGEMDAAVTRFEGKA